MATPEVLPDKPMPEPRGRPSSALGIASLLVWLTTTFTFAGLSQSPDVMCRTGLYLAYLPAVGYVIGLGLAFVGMVRDGRGICFLGMFLNVLFLLPAAFCGAMGKTYIQSGCPSTI